MRKAPAPRSSALMRDPLLRERLGRQARDGHASGYDALACRQQVAEALSSP